MAEQDTGIEETKVWRVLFCKFGELESTCNHLASDGYMIIKILQTPMANVTRGDVAVVAFSHERLAKILQARQLAEFSKQAGSGQPA